MPKKRKLSKAAQSYIHGKLTRKQKKEIDGKIVEAQAAIANLEKEIDQEASDQATLLPDGEESVAQLRFEADNANHVVGLEGMFAYCPTCNDPKVAKGRAAERALKTEMILTLRKIVGDFRADIDSRLRALSLRIEDQIKPIIAMTSSIAVERRDMADQLTQLEDNLHRAMGLDKELDPEVVSSSLFGEALADSVAPPPQPASSVPPISRNLPPDSFYQAGQEFDGVLSDGEPTPIDVVERELSVLEETFDEDDNKKEQYRQ